MWLSSSLLGMSTGSITLIKACATVGVLPFRDRASASLSAALVITQEALQLIMNLARLLRQSERSRRVRVVLAPCMCSGTWGTGCLGNHMHAGCTCRSRPAAYDQLGNQMVEVLGGSQLHCRQVKGEKEWSSTMATLCAPYALREF